MGIRHHGGGAVGQHRLDEFLRAHQRTLQMDVSVQKARQDDLAGHIHFFVAGILSHTYNEAFRHSDIGSAEGVGKYIDVGGVFQHQIRRFPSGGGIDDAPLFQQLPVDLARITLRHRTTPSVKI